jgi:hypothetical protein
MRWWTHHYIELPRDFWTINHATAEVGSTAQGRTSEGNRRPCAALGFGATAVTMAVQVVARGTGLRQTVR